MKTQINKLAAQTIISSFLIADWYTTKRCDVPPRIQKLTAANMASLETKGEKFILAGGITITFDQNENTYYIQDETA